MATFIPRTPDPLELGLQQFGQGFSGNFIKEFLQRKQQEKEARDSQLFRNSQNPEVNELNTQQRFAQGLPLLQGQQSRHTGESGPALGPGGGLAFQSKRFQEAATQQQLQQLLNPLQGQQRAAQLGLTRAQKAKLDAEVAALKTPRFVPPVTAGPNDPNGIPLGTVYRQDPVTGEIKVVVPAPTGQRLTNKEVFDASNSLRKDFDASQIKKDFDTINRSERGIAQAFNASINPKNKSRIASDQALGVLFQKMLDPDSVVRESEYARTPEGASAMNQLTSLPEKLIKGGLRLEDTDRLALKQMADKLLLESKISMNSHIERFDLIAEEGGLNKKIVFGNIKPFELGTAVPQIGQNLTLGQFENLTREQQDQYLNSRGL